MTLSSIQPNSDSITRRILYFIRNYECNIQSLTKEISEEFNITFEQSINEVDYVLNEYNLTNKQHIK